MVELYKEEVYGQEFVRGRSVTNMIVWDMNLSRMKVGKGRISG